MMGLHGASLSTSAQYHVPSFVKISQIGYPESSRKKITKSNIVSFTPLEEHVARTEVTDAT